MRLISPMIDFKSIRMSLCPKKLETVKQHNLRSVRCIFNSIIILYYLLSVTGIRLSFESQSVATKYVTHCYYINSIEMEEAEKIPKNTFFQTIPQIYSTLQSISTNTYVYLFHFFYLKTNNNKKKKVNAFYVTYRRSRIAPGSI